MNVLCTFPGKYGDLLWALPTVRAICRRLGEAVDLAIPKAFESIAPLIRPQPYIGQVYALDDWVTQDTAPISPREPPGSPTQPFMAAGLAVGGPYDVVLHLGYREWPTPDVCRHTLATANQELWAWKWKRGFDSLPPAFGVHDSLLALTEQELDLETPWILPPTRWDHRWDWCYGFTDEYFELKYGLVSLLAFGRLLDYRPPTILGRNVRWQNETDRGGTTWEVSAGILEQTKVLLTDNSALHVLAVAVGCPVVMVEPQTMRHNPVFFPLGMEGPQVTMVRGADGLPTWDVRHVADTLAVALKEHRRQWAR